jgi:hypothetical protein
MSNNTGVKSRRWRDGENRGLSPIIGEIRLETEGGHETRPDSVLAIAKIAGVAISKRW